MFLYLFVFFGLVFDFKGVDDGGEAIQIVFAAITMIGGLSIAVGSYFRSEKIERNGWDVFLPIYLLLNLFTAIFQNVEMARFLRVAFPYALLVLGFSVGRVVVQDIGFEKFKAFALTGAMFSTLFTVAFGFISTGASVEEIRYQILSPMIYIVIPILIFNIFISRKYIILSGLALLFILYLIVLSATRSWMIAFAGVTLLGSFLNDYSKMGFSRSLVLGVSKFTILVIVFLLLINIISPEIAGRMLDRVVSSKEIGFDITTATRLAEMDFQINDWLDNTSSIIFGKGLGASYSFGGENLEYLYVWLGSEGVAIDWWFAGHNFWIYSLFSQGVFLGWVIPFIIVSLFYLNGSRLFLVKIGLHVYEDKNAPMIFALSMLIISSIILSTIGGNAMGNRMLSLYIGIFLGVAANTASLNGSSLRLNKFSKKTVNVR